MILSRVVTTDRWKKLLVPWGDLHPKESRLANTAKWVEVPKSEIDEFVEEDFESSAYDSKEAYRDERMAQFCDFLKKDLCSDNYNG